MTVGRTSRLPANAAAIAFRIDAGIVLVVVLAVAAASGGYFPTSWGWTALAFAWVAELALLGSAVSLRRVEFAFVSLLTSFVLWVALSWAWSPNGSQTSLELLRDFVYPLGVAAVLLLARRGIDALVGALVAAVTLVDIYSLATRLFPDRIGEFDPVAVYRLAAPLGYWNALGIFSVIGALLSLGIAARAQAIAARATASAALLVLLPTLYFTFSRGASIALCVGIAAAIALDPRRLQLVAAAIALGVAPAAGVLLASRSDALTHAHSKLAAAAHDGHRLALVLLALALANALVAIAFAALERRTALAPRVSRALNASLAAAVLLALVGGLVAAGGPAKVERRIHRAFDAPPPQVGTNLNQRLFSLSSNGRADLWRAAWSEFKAHPLVGTGAGSYEQYWLSHRKTDLKVRDAHSLYGEVLGELGVVGLALLVTALAVPLTVLGRARRHPLVAAVFGAYVAWAFHAGVDWDWEMVAVTLAALVCGAGLLVAARDGEPRPLAGSARGAAIVAILVVMIVAFVGLVGNIELSRAGAAARAGNWQASANDARRAHAWAPWSSAPYQKLGEAQLAQGETGAAAATFRRAIAKSRDDWSLWFDLARATSGRAQTQALAQAKRLNPLSSEIATLEQELGAQGHITVGK